MKKINTIYAECSTSLWDYYFQIDNLVYNPIIWVGKENQRSIAELRNIVFINKMDFNNLQIVYDYKVSIEDEKVLNDLLNNEILYKMYFRHSLDQIPLRKICNELTIEYYKLWMYLISTHNLEAMILVEMPHLPYTYIGYLIFETLGLKILFSSSLPIKGKSFFSNSIEDYPIFTKQNLDLFKDKSIDEQEQRKYLKKLIDDYGIKVPKENVHEEKFLKMILIYLRNYLLPWKTERFKYNVIKKNKFIPLSDRKYHFEVIVRTIIRFFKKRFYKSIVNDIIDEKMFKVLYAMHYEPELAVYPLAGKNNNQFSVIKDLSNKIGDKGIIYVKEYPLVFSYSRPNGVFRENDFYIKLLDLKNVRFLDYKPPTANYISKMDLIVSLTGTIGWEAFLQKKPIIYYGFAWYGGGLPCTIQYYNDIDIVDYINFCSEIRKTINYKNIHSVLNSQIANVDVKLEYSNEQENISKAQSLKTLIESK